MHRRRSHSMMTRYQASLVSSAAPESYVSDANQSLSSIEQTNIEPTRVDMKSNKKDEDLLSPGRHKGIAFCPKRSKFTQPQPFSFESRENELLKRKQKRRIEAEILIKSMANSFRAQPMRVGSPDPLPPRSAHSPVRPVPFHFQAEERVTLRQSRRQAESTVVDEDSHSKPTVKSPSVLYRPPFVPIPPERQPLVPVTPKLATASRAVSRLMYEEEHEKRRLSLQKRLELAKLEQLKAEQQEIKVLRKELVHKPAPIRRYKTMKPIDRKLPTVPRSPNFILANRVPQSTH